MNREMQKKVVIYLSALVIFLQVPVLIGVINTRFLLFSFYDFHSWMFFTVLVLIYSVTSYGFGRFLRLAWWFPALVVIFFYLTGKAFQGSGNWTSDALEVSLHLMIVTAISLAGYFADQNTRSRLG